MRKGYFVTIEGPDGAGKTSVIEGLVKYLDKKGTDYIKTREPGGIPIAEKIREVILDPANTEMDPRTEALLYAASRRQHLVRKVLPALKEDKLVICDRFVDSSLAYQGVGREIGIDEIFSINEFAIEGYMPDLTLYLDVTPEVGIRRITANSEREFNRLDMEKIDFHNRVYEGYQEVMRRFPDRFIKINADQELTKVIDDVIKVIDEKLK